MNPQSDLRGSVPTNIRPSLSSQEGRTCAAWHLQHHLACTGHFIASPHRHRQAHHVLHHARHHHRHHHPLLRCLLFGLPKPTTACQPHAGSDIATTEQFQLLLPSLAIHLSIQTALRSRRLGSEPLPLLLSTDGMILQKSWLESWNHGLGSL